MAMRVLVDTNIILDYLLRREPVTETAKKIVKASQTKKMEGCIAAHTVSNIFYILRKIYNVEDRRMILRIACNWDAQGHFMRIILLPAI